MFSRQFPKSHLFILFFSLLILFGLGPEVWAYSNGISDGIAYNDPQIVGWATDCTGQRPAYATFGTWADALGPAPAVSNDVVSLGDAGYGYALLTFDVTIADGPGPDLAVFENAFKVGSNVFAELGFVEVSSEGDVFARFPSHSLTPAPVGSFGVIDPTNVNNLAGKHVNNEGGPWLGTPFDLAELSEHPDVQSGSIDLLNINYVKIIDVVGDGSTFDSEGNPIYDPYPTNFAAGGFDLDAVAVLNTPPLPGDTDGNGYVDDDDLSIIINNWGMQDVTRQEGDLDGSGTVDGRDYTEVLSYWGTGDPPEPSSGVPEPATLLLLFLATTAALWTRARERISRR